MEIQYAAIIPTAVCYRPFFYFRDPNCVKDMLKTADDLRIFLAESPFHMERQENLKRMISDRYPHWIYDGPMSFAEAVASDLIRAIHIDYPDQQDMSFEEFAHIQFMRSKSMLFQGYQYELEFLASMITNDIEEKGHRPIFLSSPEGYGKSSFITALKHKFSSKNPDILFIVHYTGCSDESLIVERLIDRFYACSFNKHVTRGFIDEKNGNEDSEDGTAGSNKSLFSLFNELYTSSKKVIFVIDSVHMFSASAQEPFPEKLMWIPQSLPPNVHLLLTVNEDHRSYMIMKDRGYKNMTIRLMNEGEIQQTIESYFSMYNKKLTPTQVSLLSSSEENTNPSFLKIVLDQLRTFGVYESLESEMKKLISLSSVQELYQYVIQGFEQRFGSDLVRDCLLVLFVSRTGLTVDNLMSYLTQKCVDFDPSKWKSFSFVIQDYTFVSNKKLKVIQNSLKDSIRQYYKVEDEYAQSIYHNHSEWLLTENDKIPWSEEAMRAEVAYTLWKCDKCESLAGYLSNVEVSADLLEGRFRYEFMNHWRHLRENGFSDKVTYSEIIKENTKEGEIILKYFIEVADYEFVRELLQYKLERYDSREFDNYQMGRVLYFMGKYSDALPRFKQSLSMRESATVTSKAEIGLCLHNIANVFNRLGRYEEAISYYKRSLECKIIELGDSHPEVARTLNNIGNSLRNMEKYEEAIGYYTKALEIRLAKLGDEDPQTADSYHSLGNALNNLKDYEKAIYNYEKAKLIRMITFGLYHPNTATTINNLGNVAKNQKNFALAESYYRESLRIKTLILKPDHPDIATSHHSLGNLYQAMKQNSTAHDHFKLALDIRQKLLGQDHPLTLKTMAKLRKVTPK